MNYPYPVFFALMVRYRIAVTHHTGKLFCAVFLSCLSNLRSTNCCNSPGAWMPRQNAFKARLMAKIEISPPATN